MKHRPRVSIGLPVYNGENYLAAALESILAQTYQDFELIVGDNGSTDRTEEICRAYAARDRRIRYYRNERNLGAAPNFNRCFGLARGEYFKWAAHDDELTPRYLEACVAALDADRTAVLCHTLVELIDERGATLDVHDSALRGSASPDPARRFAALALRPHQCLELDGLIRASALERTRLIGAFHGSDRALLCEIALLGRFLQVREALFRTREHPARYRRAALLPAQRYAFHDAVRVPRFLFPTWRLYAEYVAMVRRHVRDPRDRRRCWVHLVRWWPTNWNWARAIVDLVAAVAPGALSLAERWKHRVFSPEPGPSLGTHGAGAPSPVRSRSVTPAETEVDPAA